MKKHIAMKKILFLLAFTAQNLYAQELRPAYHMSQDGALSYKNGIGKSTGYFYHFYNTSLGRTLGKSGKVGILLKMRFEPEVWSLIPALSIRLKGRLLQRLEAGYGYQQPLMGAVGPKFTFLHLAYYGQSNKEGKEDKEKMEKNKILTYLTFDYSSQRQWFYGYILYFISDQIAVGAYTCQGILTGLRIQKSLKVPNGMKANIWAAIGADQRYQIGSGFLLWQYR